MILTLCRKTYHQLFRRVKSLPSLLHVHANNHSLWSPPSTPSATSSASTAEPSSAALLSASPSSPCPASATPSTPPAVSVKTTAVSTSSCTSSASLKSKMYSRPSTTTPWAATLPSGKSLGEASRRFLDMFGRYGGCFSCVGL